MSAARRQFIVPSALDDLSVMHHEQQVRLPHRCQPMRHHKHRVPLPQAFQGTEHRRLRLRVERGGRFVQDQNRRALQERPCQRESLALTARKRDAALADRRLIALWHCADELVGFGLARRFHDLVQCRLGPAVRDIVADRRREQHRLLRHNPNLAAQRAILKLSDVMSVEQYAALLGIVEAEQQAEQRGLSHPARPDERHHLPRPRLEIDALQHGPVRIVPEPHVLESHDAVAPNQRAGLRRVADRRLGFENLDNAAERRQGALNRRGDAAYRAHRAVQHPDVADEHQQFTDAEPTRQHALAANPNHRHRAHRRDQPDHKRRHHLHLRHAHVGVHALRRPRAEPAHLVLFARKGLDGANGRQRFLDHRADLAFARVILD